MSFWKLMTLTIYQFTHILAEISLMRSGQHLPEHGSGKLASGSVWAAVTESTMSWAAQATDTYFPQRWSLGDLSLIVQGR